MAIKLIEDGNLWNLDIVERTMLFDLKFTNRLEHLFINILDFKMAIKNQTIEEYFKWLILYK